MIPVYQDIFDFQRGNCLQAAVASVLELDLHSVPNFHDTAGSQDRGDVGPWAWELVFQRFLAEHNLVGISTLPDHKINGYSILCGGSPRSEIGPSGRRKAGHVVVCYNNVPVHDPHPEGDCELDGLWDRTALVTLDPRGVQGMRQRILGNVQWCDAKQLARHIKMGM